MQPELVQQQNVELLQQEFEMLRLQTHEQQLEGQVEDASIPDLADEFRVMGIDEEGDDEEMCQYLTGITEKTDFSPYSSKTSFLLDILDNLPRLQLSTNHLKMIIWVMCNCNPNEVPTYKSFRQEQTNLQQASGVPSIMYKSQCGDIFYLNDVVDLMKKNFENPETAKHIMLYPEDVDNKSQSEFMQFSHLQEHPEQLIPSYHQGSKMYYVDELAVLIDG
ncbi:hypothetical protein VKT23_000953 [Stygiomarasmius scandens]|uniref:Uncharacterized protein n=1 Tax=Marasmiellus scandens TaxID=2682957 RepID=A0ABR1KBJ6_9AGAR